MPKSISYIHFKSFGKTCEQTMGEGRESVDKICTKLFQTNYVIFEENILGIHDLKYFAFNLSFFLNGSEFASQE